MALFFIQLFSIRVFTQVDSHIWITTSSHIQLMLKTRIEEGAPHLVWCVFVDETQYSWYKASFMSTKPGRILSYVEDDVLDAQLVNTVLFWSCPWMLSLCPPAGVWSSHDNSVTVSDGSKEKAAITGF